MLLRSHLSELVFYAALAISIIAMLYTFGVLIIKDRRVLAFEENDSFSIPVNCSPTEKLKMHLEHYEYEVLNIIPVSTSNKYIVYAFKKGIPVLLNASVNDTEIEFQEEKESATDYKIMQ